MTRGELVTQSLRNAGVSDTLGTRANEWLNSWLASQYEAWPWPFLRRKASAITFTSGSTSKTVGAGQGGITNGIQRIYDPMYIYSSAYTVRGEVRIISIDDQGMNANEVINNPATHTGLPTAMKVYFNSAYQGALDLVPNTFPDRDLLLAFDYLEIPAIIDETSSGDSTKPLYPNDQTIKQALKAHALDYDKRGKEAQEAFAVLSAMIQADRVKYGARMGHNSTWGKDPTVYSRG